MSQEPFDPNAIRMRDIFRSKLAWRKRMANLPFEEKIEIVKKLQQVPSILMRNEKLIFASFLESYAELKNEIAEWDVVEEWYKRRSIASPPHPFDKRPDIIATTKSNEKIGVELKSWVNRDQIAEARKRETIEDSILKPFRVQPANVTRHVESVVLYPKVRLDGRDSTEFREQILSWIEEMDKSWSYLPKSEQNCRKNILQFADFLLLQKYLSRIEIKFASEKRNKHRWIRCPLSPSHFSPDTMLQTLRRALLDYSKDERYKNLKEKVGLDKVHLLVHYDFNAFAYNTPFDSPNSGFKAAAESAANVLNGNAGYFDRIFLYNFLSGQEEAYEIAPHFTAAIQF